MNVDSVLIRKSPIILLYRMVIATVVIYVLFAVYSAFLYEYTEPILTNVLLGKSAFAFVSILIEALTMYLLLLQWSFSYYELTDTDVTKRSGILKRQQETFSLRNTQSVHIKQGTLGTLWNYGTLELHNPLTKQDVVLRDIADARKYADIISSLINLSHQTTVVPQKSVQRN